MIGRILDVLRRRLGPPKGSPGGPRLRALLYAAALGAVAPAGAATSAELRVNVGIQGVAGVSDLTATTGVSTGTIQLVWTEPKRAGTTGPHAYDLRVSSLANIENHAQFLAAEPLSSVSPDSPPAPGGGGAQTGFVVGGLSEGVTYYFAIRQLDAGGAFGAWVRTPSNGRNVDNFAIAASALIAPPAALSLLELHVSSLTAAWTLRAGATGYVLAVSTNPGAPPSPVAASSATAASTATLAGLAPNTTHYLFAASCGASGCSSYGAYGASVTLAAAPVSLSSTAVTSTTVSLSWGAGGNPLDTLYLVRASPDGLVYSSAAFSTSPAALVSGLTPASTYWFQVLAINRAGVPSAPSDAIESVTFTGPIPSAPGGLAAQAGLKRALVSWNALDPAEQGAGLLHYRLQRSTSAGFGYVLIATTTALSHSDSGLTPNVTYYYRLSARDLSSVDGPAAGPVSALPFTLRPMEPLGVSVLPGPAHSEIRWSPVTRHEDGTSFASTGTPDGFELSEYAIFRSSDLCGAPFTQVSTMPVSVSSFTDATGGLSYHYRLFSSNSVGLSTRAAVVSSLGERRFGSEDCSFSLVLDAASAEQALNGSANGVGDVRITASRREQDLGETVLQAVEFKASIDGAGEMKNYVLPKPARVTLRFGVQDGRAVPAAATLKDLGMYWHNGVEFKKLYGRVDASAQTVSVDSPNTGLYQIRALARADSAVFDASNLASRVFTPNGDGLNDLMIFGYDPGPRNVQPQGAIFDATGAKVADMTAGAVPNTLVWNGRAGGRVVPGGVYLYRITGDGKTFTGSIVVAR